MIGGVKSEVDKGKSTFSDLNFRLHVKPLYIIWILLFLYFIATPADKLHIPFVIFKVKLTNLLCPLIAAGFCLFYRQLYLERSYIWIFLYLLVCMCLSASQSAYFSTAIWFVGFFVFTYLFYFLLPMQFVVHLPQETLWSAYSAAFIVTGCYVAAQFACSLFGINLPGVEQWFGTVARGSAFCYEPSYYALYFTPFLMFENARYLLGSSERIRLGALLFYNLCFLLSTSTSCFFIYLCFSLLQPYLALRLFALFGALCGAIYFAFPEMFQMLFKFFYIGLTHYSFVERWEGLMRDWNFFLEFPWIGMGLGAIPSYMQELAYGSAWHADIDLRNSFISTNITMELLASLGILGAVGFLWLIGRIALDFWRTLSLPITQEERIRLKALAISLLVVLFALQFNQSMMRAYLWIHVAIAVAYASSLRARKELIGQSPRFIDRRNLSAQ